MSKTVVGLFDTAQEAQNSIQDLVDAGVPRDQINVIAQDTRNTTTDTNPASTTTSAADAPLNEMVEGTERVEKGEAISKDTIAGALFGGFGGALIGVLALAIPGLGPLIAAGPIAAMLAGAATGAAGGAVIGAFEDSGINKEDAHLYAEAVRRGGTMLAVHSEDNLADKVRDILDKHGAVDVDERAASFRKEGWERFDEDAAPVPVNRTPVMAPANSIPVESVPMPANTAPATTTATERVNTTPDTSLMADRTQPSGNTYVGEGNRSPSQTASSTEPSRVNPTNTTIMTSTESVPQPSPLRSRVYDHIKT